MTYREYWNEVQELADYFKYEWRWRQVHGEDADINDAMNETIDGHQFVIYTAHAHDVLRHSTNSRAYYEEMGENPPGGYDEMAPPMAYFAMMADINDLLQ